MNYSASLENSARSAPTTLISKTGMPSSPIQIPGKECSYTPSSLSMFFGSPTSSGSWFDSRRNYSTSVTTSEPLTPSSTTVSAIRIKLKDRLEDTKQLTSEPNSKSYGYFGDLDDSEEFSSVRNLACGPY
ncbi:hypothetical protein MP638_001901 [Amoeboaphelidium occidentale]|nr:hypothetical protein MP638_001901 [Amoeboaphelidium occidentale]